MLTPNAVRKAIYGKLKAHHADFFTSNRVSLDNDPFTIPETGTWIRAAIRNQERHQVSLGGTRFRQYAVLLIQIYTDPNTGQRESDQLSNTMALQFNAVSLRVGDETTDGQVHFATAQIQEQGVSDNWNITLVECPFNYDQVIVG